MASTSSVPAHTDPLTTLPTEILLILAEFLDMISLLRFRRSSTRLRDSITFAVLSQCAKAIQERKRHRLMAAVQHLDFKGLTKLEAARRYFTLFDVPSHAVCFTPRDYSTMYVHANPNTTARRVDLEHFALLMCCLDAINTGRDTGDLTAIISTPFDKAAIRAAQASVKRTAQKRKMTTGEVEQLGPLHSPLLLVGAAYAPGINASEMVHAFDDVLAQPFERKSTACSLLYDYTAVASPFPVRELPKHLVEQLHLPSLASLTGDETCGIPVFSTRFRRAYTHMRVWTQRQELGEIAKALLVEDVEILWAGAVLRARED